MKQAMKSLLKAGIASCLLMGAAVSVDASAQIPLVPQELEQRRLEVTSHMGDHDLLILQERPHQVRNDDVHWPYRPSNALYYLTHNKMPDTALMVQKSGSGVNSTLYAKAYNARWETWEGKIPTVEDNRAESGIQNVRPASQFDAAIFQTINTMTNVAGQTPTIWLDLGELRGDDDHHRNQAQILAEELKATFPDIIIKNITPFLDEMRIEKSASELAILQRATDITVEAHKAAMLKAKTARYEYQVEATLEYVYREMGAEHWGYPSIVASGSNGTILHYQTNQEAMQEGGLMLIDAGAEVSFYSTDLTRTFPQDGTFTASQKGIYQAVLDAQNAAIDMARVGTPYSALSQRSMEVRIDALYDLGLISEKTTAQAQLYTLHGLGHTVGLDVHDPANRNAPLTAGQAWTIEPGIYVRKKHVIASDIFKALPARQQQSITAALDKYDGIGVRIEDVVLITDGDPVIMSANLPRTIADIERHMAQ